MICNIIYLSLFLFLLYSFEGVIGWQQQQNGRRTQDESYTNPSPAEWRRTRSPNWKVSHTPVLPSSQGPHNSRLVGINPTAQSLASLPAYSLQGQHQHQLQPHQNINHYQRLQHPGTGHLGNGQMQGQQVWYNHEVVPPKPLSRNLRSAYMRGYKDALRGLPSSYHQDGRSTRGQNPNIISGDHQQRQGDYSQSADIGFYSSLNGNISEDQSVFGQPKTPSPQNVAVTSNTRTASANVTRSSQLPYHAPTQPLQNTGKTIYSRPTSDQIDSETEEHSDDNSSMFDSDIESQLPRSSVSSPAPAADYSASLSSPNLSRAPQLPASPQSRGAPVVSPRPGPRQRFDAPTAQIQPAYPSYQGGSQPQLQTQYPLADNSWDTNTLLPSPPPTPPRSNGTIIREVPNVPSQQKYRHRHRQPLTMA